jgi:hypothetical protein
VRLATPLGEADVFNTHLHANYCHDYRLPPLDLRRAAAAATSQLQKGNSSLAASRAAAEAFMNGTGSPEWPGGRIPDDDDAGVRVCQLLELSEIVDIVSSSSSSAGGRLVILGGDLNCKPHTFEIDLLRLRLPELSDAWAAAAVRSSDGAADSTSNGDDSSSSSSSLLGNNPEGYTCHAPGNTFQPRRQVPERIDYVWSNMATQKAEVTLQLCPSGSSSSSSKGRKQQGRKQKLLSYSDHFAVRAVLAQPGSTAAAAGKGSSPSSDKAMKLGTNSPAAAAAAAAGAQAAQAQQQQHGEGACMELGKRVATAYAAMLLLDEGYEAAVNNGRAMLGLGAFLIASLLYVGIGIPVLWPEVTLHGFNITAAVIATALVTILGVVLFLMGQIGDRSQQRAMQGSLRQLRVWMEQQGLAAMPQQPQAVLKQQQQ